MPTSPNRFRTFYGANPLHLLALLASLALTAYVVHTLGATNLWNPKVWWQSTLVWFIGAIIAHDLILFPLYAFADRSLSSAMRAVRGRRSSEKPTLPALNFIRIPFLATALMFLIYFPGIVRQGAGTYARATGQTQDPILARWLLISAIIFALSALAYAIRLRSAKSQQTNGKPPPETVQSNSTLE